MTSCHAGEEEVTLFLANAAHRHGQADLLTVHAP